MYLGLCVITLRHCNNCYGNFLKICCLGVHEGTLPGTMQNCLISKFLLFPNIAPWEFENMGGLYLRWIVIFSTVTERHKKQ